MEGKEEILSNNLEKHSGSEKTPFSKNVSNPKPNNFSILF